MPKKMYGVLGSPAISYIDHLTPLCQILEIPLLCTDPWVYELIQLYYPQMQLLYENPQDYSLDPFLKEADFLLFVSHYKKCQGSYLIGDYTLHSHAKSIYCLHGNSDKKRNLFWAEKTADEDVALFYGNFMFDFHKEKGITERIGKIIFCGNYRLEYYKQHRIFFQQKIAPILFPKNGKKTLLYAPTWSSPNIKSEWRADYSCFFENYSFVLETIPNDFQVYVKIHPYHEQLYPAECDAIKEKYREVSRIRFVDQLPLIYPLLEHVDVYLGDYSSIGYDFLYYNRPMFFLNARKRDYKKDKGVYLHQCGIPISKNNMSHIYEMISKHLDDDQKNFKEIRKQTYDYAFTYKPLNSLKTELESLLCM